MQQLSEQKSNHLKIFGSTIPDVISAINRETNWHKPPVGPFGLYIKLLRPEWSDILESVIGNTLSTFSVQNHKDQKLLENIMKRYNWYITNIIFVNLCEIILTEFISFF